jgi:glycosyltransferase involved in cell wall biosynthesis
MTPGRPQTPGRILLTIAVPAFNEARTVSCVLDEIAAVDLPVERELLVVDDGSSDETAAVVERWISLHPDGSARLLRHEVNLGKGAAVRTMIREAAGTHLLVFDADSEYDAADIPSMVAPLLRRRAEVVYGVRVRGFDTVLPTFIHGVGNIVMTFTANLLFGAWMSDLHTCLKLLPLPLLRAMDLREEGFGLDTEITAEMLRRGFRPYEVPVSYVGRSSDEGKKIGAGDALRCFWVLGRVRARGIIHRSARDRSLIPEVAA